eukprot:SAG11_NODE_733_length_7467_cov_4.673453_3_plen_43_part_00
MEKGSRVRHQVVGRLNVTQLDVSQFVCEEPRHAVYRFHACFQ